MKYPSNGSDSQNENVHSQDPNKSTRTILDTASRLFSMPSKTPLGDVAKAYPESSN